MVTQTIPTSFASALKQFDKAHAKRKSDAEKSRVKLVKATADYTKAAKGTPPAERKMLWKKIELAQSDLRNHLKELFQFEEIYKDHLRQLWVSADPKLRVALDAAWRNK